MANILEYQSRLSDSDSRKFETFSYLPTLSKAQIRAQVAYIAARGWNPAIEYTEPQHAGGAYWYMWKLPMFGETDIDRILAEAEACRLPIRQNLHGKEIRSIKPIRPKR